MTKSIAALSVTRARKPLAFGLVLAAALVADMLVLVARTRSTEAAFPGSNGKIAFWTAASILGSADPSATDNEIFSINANATGQTRSIVSAAHENNPDWQPGP
jgi:hypothetical protein